VVETTAEYEFSPETFVLFCALAAATIIAVPLFGVFVGYSLFDWVTFVILYIVTGMGITVGYHRLVAHRSFTCHPWVKVALLIVGGWALQNSALIWCADHIRHHARTDQEEDPYNATKGFWHSHCGWIFLNRPTEPTSTRSRFGKTR
jgi:stearoyl-CoA desaturase (Delta-9 desaturase)